MAETTEKNIKINIDADIEPTLKNLRELKLQLKSAAAGSDDFRKIQAKIDDVQDSLKGAKTSAGNFVDILGTVPGPLGAIGAQASNTIDILKGFGKLNLKDIKQSFLDLGGDLKDAAVGLGRLTGITKIYTVLNNALASSFVKVGVGEAAAATGARTFAAALTATGIGAIVVAIGFAVSALMDMANAESEATREAKKLTEELDLQNKIIEANAKALARIQSRELAELKANGATEAQIRAKQLEDRKEQVSAAYDDLVKFDRIYKEAQKTLAKEYNDDTVAAEKSAYENRLKAQSAYDDAVNNVAIQGFNNKEAARKEADDAAKKADDASKRSAEEAARKKEEAYKKEVEANRQKWQKLIDDDTIAGRDTKANEVKLQEGLLAINKKYNKDTFDVAEDIRLKNAEADKKAKDDKLAFEKEVSDALVNTDIERRDQAIANEKEKFKKLLENQALSNEQRTALETALQENIDQIISDYDKKQETDQNTKLQKEKEYQKKLADIKEEALRIEYENLEMQRQELSGLDKLFDDDGIAAKIEYYNKLAALRDEQFAKERQAVVDLVTTTKEQEADKALKLQEIDKKIADNKKAVGDEIAKLEEDRNLLSLEKIGGYLQAATALLTAFADYQKMQQQLDVQATNEKWNAIEEREYLAYKAQIENESLSAEAKATIKENYTATSAENDYQRALEEYNQGKAGFENSKTVQIAQAVIAGIQGAIQSYTSLAGIPIVGPVLGGIAAAAAAASSAIQINLIKKTNYAGKKPLPPINAKKEAATSDGGSVSAASKFAYGGLLTGPQHNEGGINTEYGELEGGEFVVNRSATAAFLPLLDKINSMGSGSGALNNLSSSAESVISQERQQQIIKTYVVASDLTSEIEAQKRIADIARL